MVARHSTGRCRSTGSAPRPSACRSLYSESERPHALPLPDPELRAGIGRLLEGRRFDVAHAHDWIVNSLLGPARRSHTPVVLTQHDYSHVCATKRMMRQGSVCSGPAPVACMQCASTQYGPVVGPGVVVANSSGRRARQTNVAAFIPVSATVATRTALVGCGRYEVIPNFVPDDILVDPASIAGDRSCGPILFVGDVTRDKGADVLIDAYRRLSHPSRLVFIGRLMPDAPVEYPPGVEMLGPVPPDQVQAHVRAARVVVVPSIVLDASPTVVLEAMAAGRPVVASSSGGITDLVEDGETGILVAPGDPAALARALDDLMGDPARATEMGRRGLERVRRYTASAIADQVEGVYRRVTAGSR